MIPQHELAKQKLADELDRLATELQQCRVDLLSSTERMLHHLPFDLLWAAVGRVVDASARWDRAVWEHVYRERTKENENRENQNHIPQDGGAARG
jgi:hypothetical protein